jgi:hypothetical protein
MPKHSIADLSVRPAESWAEVRAHDQVIRYRRLGAGRAVLLVLSSAGESDPFWPQLLEALSDGRRVIVPEPPTADTEVGCWLGDFLEGLGMSNVSIVAADRFCIPALELTFLGLDQIARVMLVLSGREARGAGRGSLEAATREAAIPILVLHRDQPVEDILRLVTEFLGGT